MKKIPSKFLDPTYGESSFRRHIKIKSLNSGVVMGALEDDCHGLSVELFHENNRVKRIDAQWVRYPTTTCPGAVEAINQLVGCPVTSELNEIKRYTDPLLQCTHIHDLACLMVIRAAQIQETGEAESIVDYEAIVTDPDADNGLQQLQLVENGLKVIDWQLKGRRLCAPEKFQGVTLMKGFMGWAQDNLDANERLHGFIAQMAYFVSTSRIIDFTKTVGMQAQQVGHPARACFASQPERMAESFKMDHKRSFHDCPDELLKFTTF